MTEAEAGLESWAAIHGRSNTTAELIRLLEKMIAQLESEAGDD